MRQQYFPGWAAPAVLVLIAALASAAAALLIRGQGSSASSPSWNQIVFITIDTLRADHLGSYGYSRGSSPFLDGLAGDGVVFEQAYTASSHTAPSHATMFTSLYPFEHGLLTNGRKLKGPHPTLHALMTEAGYKTLALPAVRFMDGALGFPPSNWRAPIAGRTGKPRLYRDAAIIVNAALSWLRAKKPSEKLFLWLHFYDVHEWLREEPVPKYALQKVRSLESRFSEAEALARRPNDNYDAQLLHVDLQLQRLYREMQAHGFGSSMLWILTSDHGEGLGNHDYAGHGRFVYREQLHVPLILWAASLPKGKRVPELVGTVDLLPTMLEASGLNMKQLPNGRGEPLWRLLDGGECTAAGYSYAERRPKDHAVNRTGWEDGEVYSIQDSRYKYIFRSAAPHELYDLRSDVLELRNVIDAHPDVAGELQARLFSVRLRSSALATPGAEEPIAPSVLRELKSLGYL